MGRPRLLAAASLVAVIVMGSGALAMTPAAAAVGGRTEGERFIAPYGATVQGDAAASAGRYLLVDSNVAATGTVTSATAATTLLLTWHGEGNTRVTVSVDGKRVAVRTLTSTRFSSHAVTGHWKAGAHQVAVRLTNAATQNLYLDVVAFHSASRPSTVAEEVLPAAYTTGYTWFDNTPAGSAEISHPVLHAAAGGTGTYADPITIAVGHSLASGRDVLDHPAGTRFYLPHVRRYFMVEDTCGDGVMPQNHACHNLRTAPRGTSTWVDLYVGGGPADDRGAVQDCVSTVTDGDTELHRIIKNPASTYPVVPGPLFQNGRCTPLYPGVPRS